GNVYVINEAGITQQPQQVLNLVGGVQDVLSNQLSSAGAGGGGADVLGGYADVGTTTAATGNRFWATGLGGFLLNNNADDISSLYGGIAVGGHADLGEFTLGLVGGAAMSRLDIGNGPQTIDTTAGFAGVYGGT